MKLAEQNIPRKAFFYRPFSCFSSNLLWNVQTDDIRGNEGSN